MKMAKVRIVWNGTGGELDSTMVDANGDDSAIREALIEMVRGEIVAPGDSFAVEEVE
jgi:hypothetical protein